ncbi:MAG: sigma-70 family RNA polymerase sigma factor [Oscillospiraceae bacterium]|nr:sigma-70 family RNA polymerase sigma factor [Oscillospiraceae bacterium]
MERDDLYQELIRYISRKFASRPNIAEMSGDIVGDVYLDLYAKHGTGSDKENFGYLSVACVRQAYKRFKAWDARAAKTSALDECLNFLADDEVIDELVRSEETGEVLASLETLKTIEKAVIIGRYYGDLKFSEIAGGLGLNLNTVLSHHRRALEKLRPRLTRYFLND